MDSNISRAEELLIKLDNGEKVSRWQIFANTGAIKMYLQEEKYQHLTDKVYDLVESAKESL